MIGARARMTAVGIAGLLVMAWTRPARADEVLLDHLLADLEGFAGRHVEVAGHVENVRAGTSRRGQPQYTFDLSDGERSVMIFGSGPPPCRTGATAVVIGTVQTGKRASQTVGRIDAVEVSCR